MKVLVTGSSGFIGKYVVKKLQRIKGYKPLTFDVVHGSDVRDWKQVMNAAARADAIIHLAGVLGTAELGGTSYAAHEAIDINVKGGYNVAMVAGTYGIPLVMIDQPHIWYNTYEATKGAAIRIAKGMSLDVAFRFETVVTYNAYGPGQPHGEGHPQKIVPEFSTRAWRGEPIPIWGDGSQFVDLVYAGDVARELIKRLDPYRSGAHAATGQAKTVLQVARMVIETVVNDGGPESPIVHHAMRHGENTYVPAVSNKPGYSFSSDRFIETVHSYKESALRE